MARNIGGYRRPPTLRVRTRMVLTKFTAPTGVMLVPPIRMYIRAWLRR